LFPDIEPNVFLFLPGIAVIAVIWFGGVVIAEGLKFVMEKTIGSIEFVMRKTIGGIEFLYRKIIR